MTEVKTELGLVPNKPLQQMMISGRCIVINDPHVDQIDILDIAYALARAPRYAGNTNGEPYSVAQHSVEVCRTVKESYPNNVMLQLSALLHDAAEAALTDIPYPVKISITGFDEMESTVMRCIERKFMIYRDMCESLEVKAADWSTHQREVRDILPRPAILTPAEYWGYDPSKIEGPTIVPLHWQDAQALFIEEFMELWDNFNALRDCFA